MRAALSVFWRSLQYWSDEIALLVQMNAAWLLANLLVIPGPPATVAMLVVANRMAHGELVNWRIARVAFRRYFWKAWAWAAINLAFVGVLVFNYNFYSQTATGVLWDAARVAWVLIVFVWIALQLYWWPLMLEMSGQPLIPALQNAAKLALLNPIFTVVLLILVLLFTALSVAIPVMAVVMLTSVLALIANHATLDRLTAYREMRARLATEAEGEEAGKAVLEGMDRPARPVVVPRPPRRRSRRARQGKERKKAPRG
jgi:uncharacterized membrane protein YesL